MSIMIRKFNNRGINAFRIYLDEIRTGEIEDLPDSLITDKKLSEIIKPEIDLKKSHFNNKYEMAEYLHELLVEDNLIKNIWSDTELWSWLSAFLFDLVCPAKNGHRNPREDYRHILEVSRVGGGWSRFYRHLIACPVRLYDFSNKNSRIFLTSEIYESGDFIEQFASRRDYVSNRTAIAVLNQLYYNDNTGKAKRGSQTRTKPGNHRRYLMVLDQLSLNYDIHSMSSDELISLLPDEFDYWI